MGNLKNIHQTSTFGIGLLLLMLNGAPAVHLFLQNRGGLVNDKLPLGQRGAVERWDCCTGDSCFVVGQNCFCDEKEHNAGGLKVCPRGTIEDMV